MERLSSSAGAENCNARPTFRRVLPPVLRLERADGGSPRDEFGDFVGEDHRGRVARFKVADPHGAGAHATAAGVDRALGAPPANRLPPVAKGVHTEFGIGGRRVVRSWRIVERLM